MVAAARARHGRAVHRRKAFVGAVSAGVVLAAFLTAAPGAQAKARLAAEPEPSPEPAVTHVSPVRPHRVAPPGSQAGLAVATATGWPAEATGRVSLRGAGTAPGATARTGTS